MFGPALDWVGEMEEGAPPAPEPKALAEGGPAINRRWTAGQFSEWMGKLIGAHPKGPGHYPTLKNLSWRMGKYDGADGPHSGSDILRELDVWRKQNSSLLRENPRAMSAMRAVLPLARALADPSAFGMEEGATSVLEESSDPEEMAKFLAKAVGGSAVGVVTYLRDRVAYDKARKQLHGWGYRDLYGAGRDGRDTWTSRDKTTNVVIELRKITFRASAATAPKPSGRPSNEGFSDGHERLSVDDMRAATASLLGPGRRVNPAHLRNIERGRGGRTAILRYGTGGDYDAVEVGGEWLLTGDTPSQQR